MRETKVSSRGQTVIPRQLRKRLGIREGQRLRWIEWGENMLLVRPVSPQKRMSWKEWGMAIEGVGKEIWKGKDPVKYPKQLWDDPRA